MNQEAFFTSVKGYFISIESTAEGLGKTTQSKILEEKLTQLGYDVFVTYEPKIQEIRQMLKSKDFDLAESAEMLLFFADRAQHVHKEIKPALEAGKIVICDRYIDSSFAYQGFGRGATLNNLETLFDIATGSFYPDLTILLDGLPFRSMDMADTFESQDKEFFQRVRQGLLHQSVKFRDRFYLLNVNAELNITSSKILQQVLKRINKSKAQLRIKD